MEEGNNTIEQSITTEAQAEAPAPWNTDGLAALVPPMQFLTHLAQQMVALFQ